jgi:hypothetical protein
LLHRSLPNVLRDAASVSQTSGSFESQIFGFGGAEVDTARSHNCHGADSMTIDTVKYNPYLCIVPDGGGVSLRWSHSQSVPPFGSGLEER